MPSIPFPTSVSLTALLLLFLTGSLSAQDSLYDRTLASLPEYAEFLSIANDAEIEGQLEPNLQWLEREFGKRGFETQRLPNAGIDFLLASSAAPDQDAETVLFYGHVDGQPTDSSRWVLAPPYQPVFGLMEATEGGGVAYRSATLPARPDTGQLRLFARSSSDAKAPIMMFLVAWDEMVSRGERPNYNVKFIFDSMEETSRPDLEGAITTHRAALASDHLIILDGPVHPVNRPTLVGGARGIASATITVFGPKLPQHSGHYGNYAPNPALRLAQLLGSMKDQRGRVTIAGYYDGVVLDQATRELMSGVPDDPTEIRQRIGFAEPDGVGESLQEALQYPSLNIRGMASGWVGAETRTIIPSTAVAELDLRLVRETDGERLLGLVREHILNQGFHLIPGDREPTDEERASYPRLASMRGSGSYAAFRTDLNGPTGQWLRRALTATFGEEPILVRTMGGSVPISPFVTILEVPAVVLPLVNPDNNQHSPNENILLKNYFSGVRSLYGVLITDL